MSRHEPQAAFCGCRQLGEDVLGTPNPFQPPSPLTSKQEPDPPHSTSPSPIPTAITWYKTPTPSSSSFPSPSATAALNILLGIPPLFVGMDSKNSQQGLWMPVQALFPHRRRRRPRGWGGCQSALPLGPGSAGSPLVWAAKIDSSYSPPGPILGTGDVAAGKTKVHPHRAHDLLLLGGCPSSLGLGRGWDHNRGSTCLPPC